MCIHLLNLAVKLLYKWSKVLHIQLKRFAYGARGMVKLHDRLRFGEELDLAPFASPEVSENGGNSDGSAKYRLHAVLIHTGGANDGHYYAYVRPALAAGGRSWVRLDDTVATPISRKAVLAEGGGTGRAGLGGVSTGAYLLQYVREDAIPALLHHAEAE